MSVDNTFFIKQLRKRESLIAAFCSFTNMPFVVCDPETFNDQVWVFETEEQLQAFAKPYTEKKMLLQGRKILNKDFLGFFSSLYFIGINEIVYQGEELSPVCLELGSIVNAPDFQKMKPNQRPLMNANLQLTGLYFMQEASRPVPNEEKENLAELEEEFASNLVRCRYLLPIILLNGPGSVPDKIKNRRYQVPMVKTKDGTILQPLCSDQTELQKFAQGKKMMALTFPFAALEKTLSKEAKGYMLNPAGFHALLTREVLEALPKRFDDGEPDEEDGQEEGKES